MANEAPLTPPVGDSDDPEYAANLRRATLASTVGSALEYFDFALYGLSSALIFSTLFFSNLDPATGVVASVRHLRRRLPRPPVRRPVLRHHRRPARPQVGAGRHDPADGRSLDPDRRAAHVRDDRDLGADPAGVPAAVQGFGAGAEQAGATVLMAEYSPVKRRGFFSALPFIGIQAGTLLAAGVFAYLGALPEDVLLGWAWRVPFLASFVLILVALFIRMRLRETPDLRRAREARAGRRAAHAGDLQPLAAAACAASACGWPRTAARTCSTRSPCVATGTVMANKSVGPIAVTVGSLIGIFTVPLTGWVSDRFGRVPVYRFGAVFMLVLTFPAWWLLSLGQTWW